jgi:hypothetical protein
LLKGFPNHALVKVPANRSCAYGVVICNS